MQNSFVCLKFIQCGLENIWHESISFTFITPQSNCSASVVYIRILNLTSCPRWRAVHQEEAEGRQLGGGWLDHRTVQAQCCCRQVHPGADSTAASIPTAATVWTTAEAADSQPAGCCQRGWASPAATGGQAGLHAAATAQAGTIHGGEEDPGDGSAGDQFPWELPAHQSQAEILHSIIGSWMSQCPGNQCLGQHCT